VGGLDLSRPPRVDAAAFPDGVNVEFYQRVGVVAIAMRVHERGSGETRSCGTGAVAAAAAAATGAGKANGPVVPAGEWTVTVPGGAVTVTFDGETSRLRGPAVLVADGEIFPDFMHTG
jgi:diaminopimelate epimerase